MRKAILRKAQESGNLIMTFFAERAGALWDLPHVTVGADDVI
jgi:hypothetical protein